MLDVGDGNQVLWQSFATPDGKPAVKRAAALEALDRFADASRSPSTAEPINSSARQRLSLVTTSRRAPRLSRSVATM